MAGDWIKLEKATLTKPEVLRLASLLQCSVGDAFYCCVRFWNWCDDHLVSCHAASVTREMIDALVGREKFSSALEKVGWLEDKNGSLEVPHFDRHLSESAKKRALTSKRKQKERVTQMSRSERDKNVTREEKRRDITPPTPSERGKPPAAAGGEVERLCLQGKGLGCRALREGVVAALARVPADHVEQIITVFREKQSKRNWGGKVLYDRLLLASTDLAPDRGWDDDPTDGSHANPAADLESSHGKALDAMSPDDFQKLARHVLKDSAALSILELGGASARREKAVRNPLLRHLAQQAKETA